MSKRLPGKIVKIEQLKINRSLNKICSCDDRRFTIDAKNKRVLCDECGASLDPYDALYDLATKRERMQQEIENLLEQRKAIVNYKPWLVVIKYLEQKYRGKKMLPNCPRCSEPFYLEELNHWTGKPFADARIKKWTKENQN